MDRLTRLIEIMQRQPDAFVQEERAVWHNVTLAEVLLIIVKCQGSWGRSELSVIVKTNNLYSVAFEY